MKKKLLLSILICVLIIFTFTLSSCNNNTEDHECQWETWKTTKEPTCSAEGEKVLQCSICGTKHSSESIPTTDHSFVEGNCSACGITDPKLFRFSDLNNGTYMISAKDHEKIPAVIHIPSEYNGKPVVSITMQGFKDCTALKEITIPDSVVIIGSDAFMGCTSLTSITLPDSVSLIGESAFEDCINLKYVDTGDGLYTIGENAFKGCTSLEKIILSPIFAHISSGSFKNCTSLTKIDLPDSVDYSIRNCAFEGCEKLKTIKISDKVIIIEASAFSFCRGLESVVIGERVRTIGPGAFFGCDSLKNVFYKGTALKWSGVQISDTGNNKLSEVQMYFYSEEAPEEEGFFWHYGENGEILIWE